MSNIICAVSAEQKVIFETLRTRYGQNERLFLPKDIAKNFEIVKTIRTTRTLAGESNTRERSTETKIIHNEAERRIVRFATALTIATVLSSDSREVRYSKNEEYVNRFLKATKETLNGAEIPKTHNHGPCICESVRQLVLNGTALQLEVEYLANDVICHVDSPADEVGARTLIPAREVLRYFDSEREDIEIHLKAKQKALIKESVKATLRHKWLTAELVEWEQ